MPRGTTAQIGATYMSQNGYHYTRAEKGWRPTHQLVAEEKLGRALKSNERVRFIDGNRTNLDPKNLQVVIKKSSSLRSELARIEVRIRELQARRQEIIAQLKQRETL